MKKTGLTKNTDYNAMMKNPNLMMKNLSK